MASLPIIDVIIPAFNEERAIGQVIHEIPKHLVRDIIVCNNNSSDRTAEVAKKAGAKVVDQPQRGYGNACLKGMEYIQTQNRDHPPEIIVFIDGDYSDHPSEIPALLLPMASGSDLVIGSRVLGEALPGSMTIPQKFGNWIATRLISLLYGYRFTDLGPFRAIRWKKLLELDMQDKNFGWTVEMQVKAVKHKLSCAEVPVSYKPRIGVSKISGTVKGSLQAGYKIIWIILKSI